MFEACASGIATNRLVVVDKITGIKLLVDTGAEVSVLPKNYSDRSAPSTELVLYAANKTPIYTYGKKLLTLDLGLPKFFKWKFITADVPHAIIGADFLVHHRLIIDLGAHCLVDSP